MCPNYALKFNTVNKLHWNIGLLAFLLQPTDCSDGQALQSLTVGIRSSFQLSFDESSLSSFNNNYEIHYLFSY